MNVFQPGQLTNDGAARLTKLEALVNALANPVVAGAFGMARGADGRPIIYGPGGAVGGSGLFFAKITGNNGSTPLLYSAVEVELKSADPDTWENLAGGRVIGQWKGHRAPSKNFDQPILPTIPTGQVVLAEASATKAGHYKLTPWGGQLRVNDKNFIKNCIRCLEGMDGTFTLRNRRVYRNERWDSRDLVRYLGLAADGDTITAYPT